ncbi:MAG: hypothetical protein BGO98_37990 [Myxococcales bacterium 68-20]|nr:MAG: hypothetical protein BGO98_37990 [Myxococcales bacterium 68-20]
MRQSRPDGGATSAQLACRLARSPVIFPIPETCSPTHLEENWNAHNVRLTPEEVRPSPTMRAS